jgi:uncharacterized phiE125 gp8 family phage protein
MALQLVAPPETEPVSLEEAKAHCRVDGADDDALLEGYIAAARQRAENRTRRALITQTIRLYLDAFPDGEIRLERPPLLDLVSVKYFDPAGVEQTMDAADYQVDEYSAPPRLAPAPGKTWPTTREQMNAVAVEYSAGYGPGGADVPEPIRQAILLDVQDAYDNRGTLIVGTVSSKLARTAEALWGPYRVF